MKKILLLSIFGFQIFLFSSVNAQVLNVKNNEQINNQWCWAGCSKTILDYYGIDTAQQCNIAEYVRTTATFHSFGPVNCCNDATQGCNYWNYNYGYAGSIQDILVHFGNLQNIGVSSPLTEDEISTEIKNNRLFVIRWGWSTGGGHFIVGHGISGDNIYFMNPWYGEGLHIGTYSNVLSGVDNTSTATHTWTHTNKITSNVMAINELMSTHETITTYPNPFSKETTIQSDKMLKNATLFIYNAIGDQVRQMKNISGRSIILNRDNLPSGLYFIKLSEENTISTIGKLVITDN